MIIQYLDLFEWRNDGTDARSSAAFELPMEGGTDWFRSKSWRQLTTLGSAFLSEPKEFDVVNIRLLMVTDYDIDIRFEPVLDLFATLQMITQQNVISNWNYQFLTCCLVFITLIGLIHEFEGLFISMHHCTKLLIQPDSFRLKAVWLIMCQAQPTITRCWSFVPKHKFVWLKSCWCMRSGIVSIHQRRHISWPIWFLLFH